MSDEKTFGFPGSTGDVTRASPRVPTPGRRADSPTQQPPAHSGSAAAPLTNAVEQLTYFNQSPLISAATPLLLLSSELRTLRSHADVPGLRHQVLNAIKTFESRCKNSGTTDDVIQAARYVLCTHIDEMVLNTMWGHSSIWAQQSLLSTLHADTWGGERFFQVADAMSSDPRANPEILELLLVCLNLGFKGKYRLEDDGSFRLDGVRNALYEAVRRHKNRNSDELSPRWQPAQKLGDGLRRYIPLWVLYSVAGALLVAVYLGFTVALEGTNQTIYETLSGVSPTAKTSL